MLSLGLGKEDYLGGGGGGGVARSSERNTQDFLERVFKLKIIEFVHSGWRIQTMRACVILAARLLLT